MRYENPDVHGGRCGRRRSHRRRPVSSSASAAVRLSR
jgi:hypothetical protein